MTVHTMCCCTGYRRIARQLPKKFPSSMELFSHISDEKTVNIDTFCNLLVRMSAIGCEPSIDTYCILIARLCHDSRSDNAEQLVEFMKEKGLNPNEAIYCSLLNAYCKNLRMDAALDTLNLLSIRGFKLSLSLYAAIICALCKRKRCKEAEMVFKMLEKQWNGDEIVWTVLIDGLLKGGESQVSLNLLHAMNSKNVHISKQTYLMLAREMTITDKSITANQVADRLQVLGG